MNAGKTWTAEQKAAWIKKKRKKERKEGKKARMKEPNSGMTCQESHDPAGLVLSAWGAGWSVYKETRDLQLVTTISLIKTRTHLRCRSAHERPETLSTLVGVASEAV